MYRPTMKVYSLDSESSQELAVAREPLRYLQDVVADVAQGPLPLVVDPYGLSRTGRQAPRSAPRPACRPRRWRCHDRIKRSNWRPLFEAGPEETRVRSFFAATLRRMGT